MQKDRPITIRMDEASIMDLNYMRSCGFNKSAIIRAALEYYMYGGNSPYSGDNVDVLILKESVRQSIRNRESGCAEEK